MRQEHTSDGGSICNVQRNIWALGAYRCLHFIALSFISVTTIAASFAASLGASSKLLGALPALITGAWLLPSLFSSRFVEALPLRLPFALRCDAAVPIAFLVLTVTAFAVAGSNPNLGLALMLLAILVIYGANGLSTPATMDIIGRVIPVAVRGRFMATSRLVGNLGAFAGSFLAVGLLASGTAPYSFGWCFLLGATCMIAAYWALSMVKEPVALPTERRAPLLQYLNEVPQLLRRDGNLRWFMIARTTGFLGLMATGLFAAYGLKNFDAPTWYGGAFGSALFLGQTLGSMLLGWVADRAGHKSVITIGFVASFGANITAICAPSVDVFLIVFVLMGTQLAATDISVMNFLMDLAPSKSAFPTYLGIGNTLPTPVAIGAPVAAGIVAEITGMRLVFAAGALAALLSVGLMLAFVQSPGRSRVR